MFTSMMEHHGAPSRTMLRFLARYKSDQRGNGGMGTIDHVLVPRKHCVHDTSAWILPLHNFKEYEFCLIIMFNCVVLEKGWRMTLHSCCIWFCTLTSGCSHTDSLGNPISDINTATQLEEVVTRMVTRSRDIKMCKPPQIGFGDDKRHLFTPGAVVSKLALVLNRVCLATSCTGACWFIAYMSFNAIMRTVICMMTTNYCFCDELIV